MSSWLQFPLSYPSLLPEAQRKVKVKILVNNKFTQCEFILFSNASNPSLFSKDVSYQNSWYMFKFYQNFYRPAYCGEKSGSTFLHTDVCCQLTFGQFNPWPAMGTDINCFIPKPKQTLSSIIKSHVCVDIANRFQRNISWSQGDSQACAAIWWIWLPQGGRLEPSAVPSAIGMLIPAIPKAESITIGIISW